MKFPVVEVKAVRTDLKKGKLYLAFEVRLNDEILRLAQALAEGADASSGRASLEVELAQATLLGIGIEINRQTGEIKAVDLEGEE